jgi:outer membrane protein W
MKNIKYILIVIAAFVVFMPSKSQAQYNEFFLGYNFAVPMPDSKDYVSNVSYYGVDLNYKRFVNRNTSVSLSFAWNVFYKETRDVIALPNADLSGLQNRYINTLPMLVGVQYYIGKSKTRPYAGANLGALYSSRRLQMGIYEITDYKWRFMVQPELGVLINVDNHSDVALGVSYNYGFAATSTITGKDVTESWIGIKLAYGWKQGY